MSDFGQTSGIDLVVREQYVSTPDGWSLKLRRTLSPHHFNPRSKPLLIVPGYGMNSFIFSYHPRGTSMERCLAEGGFEVWAMDLRGQGESKAIVRRPGAVSLANYAALDVPTAIERVLTTTETRARTVTMVGASLGGSIAYGYLALNKKARVSEVITMGAPLRWSDVHPLLRLAFASPALVGSIRMSGTRALVDKAFPFLVKVPQLLSLYMNHATIDITRMREMVQTVEDPSPRVNRDLATWIRKGDLFLEGVNVTRALRHVEIPLLLVLSNRDGIVPRKSTESVIDAWGGEDLEVLVAGDDDNWYAHANLFIADDCPSLVFTPIIHWLRRHA